MHIFTITIHSNLFGENPSDEILEKMALEYYNELNKSLSNHNLKNYFKVEAYWMRGSLVEHLLLVLQNADLIEMFTAAGTYKVLKEYKSLRESVILVADDLKTFQKKVSGIFLSTKDLFISDTKPPMKSKKLEMNTNYEIDTEPK